MPIFEKNNKAAEKWTEQEAKKAFTEMLNFCYDNEDVLSLQQAYLDYGMHPSTYYYLTSKFPVLETFKKGMADIIVARVNKGAINKEFDTTACIWRSKQLGEKDTQYQKLDATVDNVTKLTPEQRAKRIEELKRKLNAE